MKDRTDKDQAKSRSLNNIPMKKSLWFLKKPVEPFHSDSLDPLRCSSQRISRECVCGSGAEVYGRREFAAPIFKPLLLLWGAKTKENKVWRYTF
jgi:hypothetical protein